MRARPRRSSATPAASRRRASSRACGSRCSSLWSWDEVPALPPEQILLPPRAPLSIYSFGCWARQTIVALSVVLGAAAGDDGRRSAIDELLTGAAPPRRRPTPGAARSTLLDRGAAPLRAPAGRAAAPPRAARGRALDRRAPGARRLVGRHPAAVGLVDRSRCTRSATALDHPVLERALAGLDSFTIEDERGPPDRGVPVAGLGHGARADRAARRGPRARARPASTRGARWLAGREVRDPRRLGRAPAGPRRRAASRSSSRTTTTPTSTTRPSSCSRCAARRQRRRRRRASAALAWTLGMQSGDGGWGAFDVDNTSSSAAKLAVLRLRRGHRPAERRRDRAHGRDCSRTRAARGRAATRARARLPAARAGARRLVVRPLGRELRLRHRRRPCRRSPPAACATTRACAPRVDVARARAERRRRLRRGPPLVPRRRLARPRRVDRVADRVGAARPPRRRRADGAAVERAVALARRDAAAATAAGTSRTTRAPASPATSTSTTTSTGTSSR